MKLADVSNRTWRQLFIWLTMAAALVSDALAHQAQVLSWPHLKTIIDPSDPDIWTRLTAVRGWLSGHDFYSHAIAATNAPVGGINTHWTRPIDFLLAFFVKLMPSGFSLDQKLLLAATWMPPLIGFVTLVLLVRACMRQFNNTHVAIIAILMMITNLVMNYFAPGDADHHGLLTMLWCGVIYIATAPLNPKRGAIMGLLLGLMLWVSPEAMMLIAVTYGVLGLMALYKPEEMRPLALSAVVLVLTSALALLLEVPASQYFTHVSYDSLSIVYVTYMGLLAAGMLAVAQVFPRLASIRGRLVAAGIAAAAVAGAGLYAFPKILKGPLVDADPFIFKHFLGSIVEMQSIYQLPAGDMVSFGYLMLTTLFILGCAWSSKRSLLKKRPLVVMTAVFLSTALMTFFSLRWNYYLQPAAIFIIATVLPSLSMGARAPGFRWLKYMMRMLRPYLWLAVVRFSFCILSMVLATKNQELTDFNACDIQLHYIIETGQLQKQLGKSDVLFVTPNLSGAMIFFTPYHVIAGNYHREGKGLEAIQDISIARTAAEARGLMKQRKVDTVLVCPNEYPKDSWVHALDKGHPAWLKPVGKFEYLKFSDSKKTPLLFRVVK